MNDLNDIEDMFKKDPVEPTFGSDRTAIAKKKLITRKAKAKRAEREAKSAAALNTLADFNV